MRRLLTVLVMGSFAAALAGCGGSSEGDEEARCEQQPTPATGRCRRRGSGERGGGADGGYARDAGGGGAPGGESQGGGGGPPGGGGGMPDMSQMRAWRREWGGPRGGAPGGAGGGRAPSAEKSDLVLPGLLKYIPPTLTQATGLDVKAVSGDKANLTGVKLLQEFESILSIFEQGGNQAESGGIRSGRVQSHDRRPVDLRQDQWWYRRLHQEDGCQHHRKGRQVEDQSALGRPATKCRPTPEGKVLLLGRASTLKAALSSPTTGGVRGGIEAMAQPEPTTGSRETRRRQPSGWQEAIFHCWRTMPLRGADAWLCDGNGGGCGCGPCGRRGGWASSGIRSSGGNGRWPPGWNAWWRPRWNAGWRSGGMPGGMPGGAGEAAREAPAENGSTRYSV